jgi:hypothetical protein
MNMKEHYIIEFLNCKKDFKKDSVHFKGTDSYEEAVTWGKKNLDNFHLDMIKVVCLDHHLSSSNSNK